MVAGTSMSREEEEVWSPVVESAMRSGTPVRQRVAEIRRAPRMKQIYISSAAYMVNMCIVSGWSPGVLLYVYNTKYVHLAYLGEITTSLFFSVFSSFGFVADLLSRKFVYLPSFSSTSVQPPYLLLFTLLGVTVLALQEPELAPLGTLMVFLGNGSIYACSCRLIDGLASEDEMRKANTVFFAAGDVGAILGASLIPHLRALMMFK
jgi:hypothetical protein